MKSSVVEFTYLREVLGLQGFIAPEVEMDLVPMAEGDCQVGVFSQEGWTEGAEELVNRMMKAIGVEVWGKLVPTANKTTDVPWKNLYVIGFGDKVEPHSDRWLPNLDVKEWKVDPVFIDFSLTSLLIGDVQEVQMRKKHVWTILQTWVRKWPSA